MTAGTGFLYPFLSDGGTTTAELIADLTRSAAAKWHESVALAQTTLEREAPRIKRLARAIVDRSRAGGRVLTIGNGGSATDASDLARRLTVPALCLADDPAVITALANDIGAASMFTRQVLAVGRPSDIVIGFSTSGDSENVIAALLAAETACMAAAGFAGYGGGRMAASVSEVLTVDSQSVHRIQEVQTELAVALCSAVDAALAP